MQKSSSINFSSFSGRLIIAVCIILISSLLYSCGRAHYVRGSKIGGYDKRAKAAPAPQESEFAAELEKFEHNLKKPGIDPIDTVEDINDTEEKVIEEERAATRPDMQSAVALQEERKLPTLRKQMQDIGQKQSELKNRVDKMQDDVEEIKATVGEIHNAIKYIAKPDGRAYPGDAPRETAKPANTDGDLILPDNEPAEKPVKKPAPAVKKIKILDKEASRPTSRVPKPIRVKPRKATAPADNDSAEEQNRIAEQRLRSGNLQEAKAAYRAIIEKYPNSRLVPKAKKMLQQL